MSGVTVGWVFRHGPTDRTLRLVLAAVADGADRNGEHARPGVPALCRATLYSRAQVHRALARLVADGWLEVEEAGGGRGRATTYRVPMRRPETVSSSETVSRAETVSSEHPKPSHLSTERVSFRRSAPLYATDNGKYATGGPSSWREEVVEEDLERTGPGRELAKWEGRPTREEQTGMILGEVARREGHPLTAKARTALRDAVPDLLAAGHDPEAIVEAIVASPWRTAAAVEGELRKRRPTRPDEVPDNIRALRRLFRDQEEPTA